MAKRWFVKQFEENSAKGVTEMEVTIIFEGDSSPRYFRTTESVTQETIIDAYISIEWQEALFPFNEVEEVGLT